VSQLTLTTLILAAWELIPAPKKPCTPATKAPKMIKWADGRATFEGVRTLIGNE